VIEYDRLCNNFEYCQKGISKLMISEHLSISSIERQDEIYSVINRDSRITVAQICKNFGVSEATARRDLETLAEQGKVHRVHGGAISQRKAPPEKPIFERSTVQAEEKKRIGKLAASLINDGETIFLGSGSTVYEIAKNLHGKRDLTIVTNSLLVINELADKKDITIISIGGILRMSERSFIGHIAQQAIGELRADKVFMGIRAISLDQGLTNDYLPETMTDRAIMGVGRQVIIVADYTKCERVSTAYVAPLESIDVLVTTKESTQEFVQSLIEKGINVLLA
jgi:DeoR family transcriptional regulator, aga operon transcriptional repressor